MILKNKVKYLIDIEKSNICLHAKKGKLQNNNITLFC